ncbi:MAG: alanine:cation symporter family protein [Puniceicoccales bacterium]|jgi:AGCS family alanine or glycine:cation symporter|nr:alanine:cation symporter family protein [Puniceicoccales bacterium]
MEIFLQYIVLFLLFPLLIGLSSYFSFRLRWPQLRFLGKGFSHVLVKGGKTGGMSNFAAVATVVGGNLGAGTIAGTALAIAMGGAGSIFWMVAIAIFCSILKLIGASLGAFYQEEGRDGNCVGGPMFYMKKGKLPSGLSTCYCLFLIGGSLSVGNLVQMNSFLNSLQNPTFAMKVIGIIALAIPVGIILSGGLKRFASFMSCSIPIIGVFYIIACLIGIIVLRQRVIPVIGEIFNGAFTLRAVGSGTFGFAFLRALHVGISRGLFATDIGLGLAAIAHGNVKDDIASSMMRAQVQGQIALIAPVIVAAICSVTGIFILCAAPDFSKSASQICVDTFVLAFKTHYAGLFIPFIIYSFALTTILAWAWFAEHVFFFYEKPQLRLYYRALFIAVLPAGAFVHNRLPWNLADICICGLLLSNLTSMFLLRKKAEEIQSAN